MNLKTLWTPAEITIVRKHYPTGGQEACLPFLPTRTLDAIRERAHRLGIRLNEDVARERISNGWRKNNNLTPRETLNLDDRPLLDAMSGLDNVTRARLAEQGA